MSTPFCVSPPNLAHRTKKHRKTCSKHRSPPLTSLPTVTPPHLMYSPVGPDDPVRPYTRLPIAFAPSVRADVGIRPYKITGGVCVIRTGGQSRPPLHTISRRQNISNRRPKAATYLCRFAAKARFDNRLTQGAGVSKEGGPQPSLFGRSRMGDFQGGRKIETSFPLEWRFWLLLSLLTKVTRRRQQKKNPKAARCSHRAAHDQILYSSASFQPSTSAAAIRRPRRGRSNSPS